MSGRLAVERLGLKRDTLHDQVAIVTGAGRGIGREVARALAWLEARVIIAEREALIQTIIGALNRFHLATPPIAM